MCQHMLSAVLHCCLQLLGENAAKISNFASYLRSVFRTDTDPTTLEVAAATLGHLVQTGGALTADVVEYEVRSAPDVQDSLLCRHVFAFSSA